jgi:2-methylcitrate dehydratase PrpD
MLRFGEARLDQLTDEGIVDPANLAIAEKVTMTSDPEIDDKGPLGRHASRVTIELTDGRRLVQELAHRPGSQQMPVSEQDVREKFHSLVDPKLSRAQAAEIEKAVFELPDVEDISTFTALLALAPATQG